MHGKKHAFLLNLCRVDITKTVISLKGFGKFRRFLMTHMPKIVSFGVLINSLKTLGAGRPNFHLPHLWQVLLQPLEPSEYRCPYLLLLPYLCSLQAACYLYCNHHPLAIFGLAIKKKNSLLQSQGFMKVCLKIAATPCTFESPVMWWSG
jgi:hypothetical protein